MKNPSAYIAEVLRHGKSSEKPVLAEAPFSVSQIVDPLRVHGLEVECVFIQEDLDTIRDRYIRRECKEIPQGHLTRQSTYLDRAIAMQAYYGTSQEVLNYLKSKA